MGKPTCFPAHSNLAIVSFNLRFETLISEPADQETFISECEVIRSELMESEVTVEGEYVSKKTMAESWGWKESLGTILPTKPGGTCDRNSGHLPFTRWQVHVFSLKGPRCWW